MAISDDEKVILKNYFLEGFPNIQDLIDSGSAFLEDMLKESGASAKSCGLFTLKLVKWKEQFAKMKGIYNVSSYPIHPYF